MNGARSIQVARQASLAVGLSILFLQVSSVAEASEAASAPPHNVVFILTDDQRYDELGFLNDEVTTPQLDQLAAEGVHVRNSFVTTSLCSPSRASILSGQYAHAHGIVDNLERDTAPGTVFFPEMLQAAGYQTAFIGKWHLGRHEDTPQPGFDRWVSFAGQGVYYPGADSTLNVDGERVPQKGYITDELTDYALDWLGSIDRDRGFFLYLSHKAVHADFLPAERHRGQHPSGEINLPRAAASGYQYPEGTPMWVRNQRNSWHGVEFPYHSDLDLREYRQRYHEALMAVDESLGRVREALSELGLADNTLVVFMGDNGFLFGEHGLIDKRNAYEESMRVPLIVQGAGLPAGATVDDMVLNIDIAPTLLEWTGTEPTTTMHGRSFLPQLRGESVNNWRTEFLYEYFWEWVFPHTPTTFALRTDRYKLIQYHGIWDTDELYDLHADPAEQVNLIGRPEYRDLAQSMRERLFRSIRETDGTPSVPFTMKRGPGLHYRRASGSHAAPFPGKLLRTGHEDDLEHYTD
ncbi:sulfatase family protein [Elongatibacter sediminis]|uniref:Sulfatase n=1 Tax=Elongatibacter sediminis TaxID=3119006 RepID=A0AAW9RLW7_9GAMM